MLKIKIVVRKCLGVMCVLFIIVLNNYIFIFVNVNVDKKKNFFVIGYCYNLDYVVLKK